MCLRKEDKKVLLCIIVTWLADKEANIISEDRCDTVQEVTGQLHHDRQFRQLLQDLSGL